MKLIFDDGSREFILSAFNKGIDDDGFIFDKLDNSRVLTPEGKEILAKDLAVIKKGSEKFIAGDLTSLMKLTKGEL